MTENGWLAQTFAAPAIGIQTRAWLGFAPGVWTALETLQQRPGDVTIHANSAVAVRVVRSNGIYFDLSPTTITAGFTFQLALEQRAGGLPELVSPKDVRSFPELMAEVVSELHAFIDACGNLGHGRAVQRIGCVADCRIAEDSAPPGIAKLIAHLGSPWPKRFKATESSLLIELANDAKTRDPCHHVVSLNAYDRPNDLGFKLDWQRLWPAMPTMHSGDLKSAVTQASEKAMKYFQEFGEGAWGE